ncbi:MAG: tetratricopeptide repeat protein, partial [Bacteroidota bacterium]
MAGGDFHTFQVSFFMGIPQFRRFFSVTLFALLASALASGQDVQRKIDSLNLLISKTGDRVAKVRLMNDLSFELIPVDIARATDVAEQAVEEAEKAGKDDVLAWALIGQATCLQTEGDTRRAESIIYRALDLNVGLKDQAIEGYAINLLGNAYRDKGKFDSAYFHYNKARRTMARLNDRIFPLVYHLEIARYFIILERPDSTLDHVEKVLREMEKAENRNILREALILEASALGLKFQYKESEAIL